MIVIILDREYCADLMNFTGLSDDELYAKQLLKVRQAWLTLS